MSFETECFSMNSDISKRTSDFSEPNRNSARRRATSVLPTPVGPRKKKQPTGRAGFFNVLAGDDAGGSVVQLVAFAEAAKIFLFLAFFFGIEAGFFEFVRGDGAFHAMGDELDALLYFADFFGNAGLAQLDARAGFVD